MKTPGLENTISKIFFVLTGLIGFFLIYFVTRNGGIGLAPDSAGYLASAENIASGKGISILYDSSGFPLRTWLPWSDNQIFHVLPWPPFLSIVLSIFSLLKLDPIIAGRFLFAAIFGANIFLVTFIVKKYAKSTFLMVLAPIILISSKDMIQIHSVLLSESLFILMSLLGFLFLIKFLEKKKLIFLLIASLFFGLGFLTRTVGASLVATGVIAVLVYSGLRPVKKIIYSILSAVIGILPFFIWTISNYLNYGSSVEFIYHPFKLFYYTRILSTISLWIMPDKIPEMTRIILLIILLAIIISIASYMAFKNRESSQDDDHRLNSKITGIFLFYVLFYFMALMLARHFFNNAINLGDVRMLGPILLIIFTAFLFFLKRFLDIFSNKENIKIIAYFFCSFLIAAALYNSNAVHLYKNGHASKIWYQSETINELKRTLDPQDRIYTNEPAVIYLFLGRSSIYLPLKRNIHTNRENPNYENDLDIIMKEIKENEGILVFFDGGWGVFPVEQEISLDYRLILLKDTADGAIYRLDN